MNLYGALILVPVMGLLMLNGFLYAAFATYNVWKVFK